MQPTPRVFISATSADLASYRTAVKDALQTNGVLPIEQTVFPPDFRTIEEMLEKKIRGCDAVVCLVGFVYGREPSGQPAGQPRRSYTQIEFDIACKLGKPVYRFLATEDCAFDARPQESPELQALQLAHRGSIEAGNQVWERFSDREQLRQRIAHIQFDKPPQTRPFYLPYSTIGSLFKGRNLFIEKIREHLLAESGPGGAAPAARAARPLALCGLGGVGKTRLAVEYGWRFKDEYTAVLFVVADSPESLHRNLAQLTGPLILNLPEQNLTEQEAKTAAAIRWLLEHPGWFLILDNVDTEEAVHAVTELLSSLSRAGHVVLTSRFSHWSGEIEPLDLGLLDKPSSVAYLLESTAGKRRKEPDDEPRALALAIELDRLALALEQAAAYINAQECSFADYQAALSRHPDRLLDTLDPLVTHYPKSVARTWLTTFEQLTDPARQLLRLLGWLAPDPVPRSLLRAGGGPFAPENWRQAPSEEQEEWTRQAEDALANLRRYSLAASSEDKLSFTVHRLVQDVTRRTLPDAEKLPCLKQALRWIDDAFVGDPDDVRTWPLLEPLVPHARAVAAVADQQKVPDPTARLMNQVGLLLKVKAQFAEAEPLMRRALAIDERSYGPDHPNVAIRLSNLAGLLQATNRLAEAEPLMRRAVSIFEISLGENHPNVATTLSNLAQLLQATNRLAEAEPLMRRALAIGEQSYGPDHPKAAIRLNNLAQLLQDTNRLAEAEPLMRRALAIDERSYGPDHPNVAIRLSNLAGLLQATNRLAEAEPLMRRVVEILLNFTRATGHPHPNLQAAVNNYARLLQTMGRSEEQILAALRELAP